MRLALTPEQTDLRAAVREFCRDHGSETDLRRMMDLPDGFDPKVRDQVVAMGLLGLGVPEEYGGAGGGWVEIGVVGEELGRALLPVPYLSAVLAVAALLEFGDPDAKAAYLPRIVDGSLAATLGVTSSAASWDVDGVGASARPAGSGDWTLDGHASYVYDGLNADVVLVLARTPDGIGVFAVDTAAPGVERCALRAVDRTRPQARIDFRASPARAIGELDQTGRQVSRLLGLGAVALAAESVGGAQRVLEMAVDYAKVRKQFGRPIGSFQAIKHLCADVLVRVESARSAAYYALFAADAASTGSSDDREFRVAAGLAKAHCGDAFRYAAEQNVLVHGAIGLSWEHSAQLYLKRARTTDLMFGDSTHHRALLADRIEL